MSAASKNATQLFQDLELASALINVFFTLYDIDDTISASRAPVSWISLIGSRKDVLCRSESSGPKMIDEERVVQEQAPKLCLALDGVPGLIKANIAIGDVCKDEDSFMCKLAVAILEQVVADDYAAATALQNGHDLPPVTGCQTIVQHPRFFKLIETTDDVLVDTKADDALRLIYDTANARVIRAFVKQGDIDTNREGFAWRNGQNILDKTSCQVLAEHRVFGLLFDEIKEAYYESLQPVAEQFSLTASLFDDGELPQVPEQRVECVGCCDILLAIDCLKAPCDHFFCEGCIVTLVGICIKDEGSFPMKCCKEPMKPADVSPFLDATLRLLFAAACLEFGTPAEHRIYCPQAKCSVFLGSAEARKGQTVSCKSCDISICADCRERAHPDDDCEQSQLVASLRKLAEEQKWRACPKCNGIIERTEGCNHMVCRCTQEFCYTCGLPWRPRTCTCT